ncbi:MAG: UDP-3-O-(3-hydroxymyristoyl)glucosamine N-acyltransferase [Pseudomonadota bacterium]
MGAVADHLELICDEEHRLIELESIRPLSLAGGRDLAFVAEKKYLCELGATEAACVLLKPEWVAECPVPSLATDEPYLAYAKASSLFSREPRPEPGVHPTAVVHESVDVPASASIGAFVCVEAGVVLGEGVVVHSGCHLGQEARIGARTVLHPRVVLYHCVVIGKDCAIHANTVIGADGFGFARHSEGWSKISQLGSVLIGDRVDVGASSTIDRGALEDTVIGNDVIIDDQVHIGHNCVVGDGTAFAGCVGVAGSTSIGKDCTFAGQVGIAGHIEICDGAHFTGQARVTGSIKQAGEYASGTPLGPRREWSKNAVRFNKLDGMYRRIAALEAALDAAESSAEYDSGASDS